MRKSCSAIRFYIETIEKEELEAEEPALDVFVTEVNIRNTY